MKKAVSIILSVLMLFGAIPYMSAAALITEEPVEQTTEAEAETTIDVSSESSMGNMINNALADSENNGEDISNKVLEVKVSGKTAYVSFNNTQPFKLIVGIFDENGEQMYCSGMADIDKANAGNATVELNTDSMPEYYTVKAYMLSEDNKPLGPQYQSDYYTKEIQKLLGLTVDDFDEELVCNFDDNGDNNFAVFKESAKRISVGNRNTLSSYDEETGTYVFSNINNDIRNLDENDVFYFIKDDNYVIVDVDTIEIYGNEAIITEDKDIRLDEVFDCVKIDSDADSSESEVNTENADEGITYTDDEQPAVNGNKVPESVGAVEKEFSKVIPKKFDLNKTLEKGSLKVNLTGSVEEKLILNLKIYLYSNKCTVDLSLKNELTLNAEIDGKFDKTFIKLGQIPLPVLGGAIKVNIEVGLTINASVNIKYNAVLTSEKAFSLTVFFNGTTSFSDMSKPDVFESDIDINGEFFVGVSLDVNIGCSFLKLGVVVTPGVKVTATNRKDTGTAKHSCALCIEGTATLLADGSVYAKLSVFGRDLEKRFQFLKLEKKLLDFYVSTSLGAGKGKCPNILTTLPANMPLGAYKLKSSQGIYKNYKTGERFITNNSVNAGAYVYIRNIVREVNGNVWGCFNFWYKTSGTTGTENDVNRNAWLLLSSSTSTYAIFQASPPQTGTYITNGDVYLRKGPNYYGTPTYAANGVTSKGDVVNVVDVEVRYQTDLLEWTYDVISGNIRGYARDSFFTKSQSNAKSKSAVSPVGAVHSDITVQDHTVTKENAVADKDYILVITSNEQNSLSLNSDTLLYISQSTADSNGTVSFEYYGDFENMHTAVLGECNHISSDWITVCEPDGESVGKRVKICSVCGEITIEGVKLAPGDTDGSGKVTITDVTYLQKHLVELLVMDDAGLEVADVNHDNRVDIRDATIIQKYIVALIAVLT